MHILSLNYFIVSFPAVEFLMAYVRNFLEFILDAYLDYFFFISNSNFFSRGFFSFFFLLMLFSAF